MKTKLFENFDEYVDKKKDYPGLWNIIIVNTICIKGFYEIIKIENL